MIQKDYGLGRVMFIKILGIVLPIIASSIENQKKN